MAEETQPPIQTIWTPRLHLQTVQMSDLEAGIMSFLTLPQVMQFTSTSPVSTLAQGRQWLSARAQGSQVYNFAIRERSRENGCESLSRVIGLVGAFHPPSCGYMLHPDYAGKGYATEGLRAWVRAYWEFVAASTVTGTGDGEGGGEFLDAFVDAENLASMRVLEKVGFTRCEVLRDLGGRESVAWRLARPGGRSLEELGLLPQRGSYVEDEPPVPPVQ